MTGGVAGHGAVCDFCGAAGPRWILVANGANIEDADWLACGPCWALIREGDREGLAARAIAAHDGQAEVVREAVALTHGAFWNGYRGGGRFLR